LENSKNVRDAFGRIRNVGVPRSNVNPGAVVFPAVNSFQAQIIEYLFLDDLLADASGFSSQICLELIVCRIKIVLYAPAGPELRHVYDCCHWSLPASVGDSAPFKKNSDL
jgi:hypothetical protein